MVEDLDERACRGRRLVAGAVRGGCRVVLGEADHIQHEQTVRRRITDPLGLVGRLLHRQIVDTAALGDDEADQLGVEARDPLADLFVRRLGDDLQPLAQALGHHLVPLPQGKVHHHLQLFGARVLQDVTGVAQADLMQHVVELVAGQGADGLFGIRCRQQGVGAAQAFAAAQLGTVARQGDHVVGR